MTTAFILLSTIVTESTEQGVIALRASSRQDPAALQKVPDLISVGVSPL